MSLWRQLARGVRVLGLPPLRVEPPGTLEALQGGEQGAGVDLEDVARDLLDAPRDAEAVHRLEAERLEDQHVQRALNDVGGWFVHWPPRVPGLAPRVVAFILTVKM